MPFKISKLIVPVCIYALAIGCKAQPSQLAAIDPQTFSDYWYQGTAEISTYELSQSRYGAVHDGVVNLVFVTEDLSNAKHVKLDDPVRHASDAIKVLKLNTMKEFTTGIYKYSMMSSVFTPVNFNKHPHSLKLTCSSQDWCGQSFMQANWKGNRYEVQHMSYFESEGDDSYSLMTPRLEDEIWTKIRLAPNTLPIGDVKMVASAFYIRLAHKPNIVYDAITSLNTSTSDYTYKIEYPKLKRTIEITFQSTFPHKILGWKEMYGDGEITTAKIISTIISDYWNRNHPEDENLRIELKLKN